MAIDSLIGKQIGNYKIERVLGRGGMATVYFGQDARLHRAVAIKVIDERYRGNTAYQDRFMREAGMIAALRHPNILEVYYAGEEAELYYFVMEYIPGKDLAKVLQEQKSAGGLLPLYEVLRIGGAVAEALDYAHRQGVIHRDVKPSNVIITQDGRVVLTDFGIAMDVARGTMGEVFGSPYYISPEQARSSAQAVPQSDLYSLAVMLFEMLTGSVPFSDASAAALAVQHISQAPPSPRSINPALPQAAEAVLLKALRKLPAERYPTGLALMKALSSALDAGVPATQPMVPVISPPPPGSGQTAVNPFSLAQAASAKQTGPAAPPAATVNRTPRNSLNRWGIGCGILLAILLVGGTLGILGAGKVFGLFGLPPTTAPGIHPVQTIPATAVRSSPTATLSVPAVLPTQVFATDTASATATSTQTETPTPTASPTPQPIAQSIQFTLPRKTTSLVVINQGEGSLSLKNLLLKGTSSQIQGEDWDAIVMDKGQCIYVLSTGKDAGRIGPQPCKQAHPALTRSSDHPFWTGKFDVYYQGEHVGACSGLSEHESCTLRFTFIPTATPLPTLKPPAKIP